MMISFPVFQHVDISGYGLFPGTEGSAPGLHISFQPGLTLVLGTNGLGKTTLITIVFRLLTGPFDLPRLEYRSDLGGISLEPVQLPLAVRTTFGRRVMDGARDAHARLTFRLGSRVVVIERRLSDLTLTQFVVDGQEMPIDEKEAFQVEIPKLVGISSFGDWILLLRYLVFYFEDRRALVWDPSAQRQILRILFLPDFTSKKWIEDERAILELDSRMRNLRAAVGREDRALASNEARRATNADVHDELTALGNQQKTDTQLCEHLEGELLDVDALRRQARLRVLRAEQEREARYRGLERVKLLAIGSRFPNRSEIARYILAQLLTNQICIVCGSRVPQAAAEYSSRIGRDQCVVCGSGLGGSDLLSTTGSDEAIKAVAQASVDLKLTETDLDEAHQVLEEAEGNYKSHVGQIAELRSVISDRAQRIDRLVLQLPPEEAEMRKQRSELASLRGRVEEMKIQLAAKRELFGKFVEGVNRDVASWKDAIKASFDEHAKEFLLEQCQLIWSPQRTAIGQEGDPILFPAFELNMAGADFPSPVRRSGPEQVSESQREFIDLAFRIALMSVSVNEGGSSSLVMDAPESSLDAVFSSRAANVLSRFADPRLDNRLLITSNLVEGQLIPALIDRSTTFADRAERVVDLIRAAAPTAAVREHRDEYEAILDNLLAGQGVEVSPDATA